MSSASAAHDEDGLVADGVLEEVAAVGNLLLPASYLPHMRPQELHFEVEELLRGVAGAGDDHHPSGLSQSMSVVDHGHQMNTPCRTIRGQRLAGRRQHRRCPRISSRTIRQRPAHLSVPRPTRYCCWRARRPPELPRRCPGGGPLAGSRRLLLHEAAHRCRCRSPQGRAPRGPPAPQLVTVSLRGSGWRSRWRALPVSRRRAT